MFLCVVYVFQWCSIVSPLSYEEENLRHPGFEYMGDWYYKSCGAELIQWAHDVCSNCQSEMHEHDSVLEFSYKRQFDLDHKNIAQLCCEGQCSRRHIREMCCF